MGDFTLGCLIGTNQSFDTWGTTTPNSWSFLASVCSAYQTTQAHSSAQGVRMEVYSNALFEAGIRFGYGYGDVRSRHFPDVETHAMHVSVWANPLAAADSGGFQIQLVSGAGVIGSQIISYTGNHARYNVAIQTTSWGGLYPYLDLQSVAAITGSLGILFDDVLARVDQITLYPEWSFQEQARLVQSRHRSLGGKEHVYTWGKYFAYEVPLRFLSTSHAALINWWWEKQFHLLFTLDTSDSESSFIVRIANDRQPIGGRVKPYADLFQGVLQLESVHDGRLNF